MSCTSIAVIDTVIPSYQPFCLRLYQWTRANFRRQPIRHGRVYSGH